MVVIKQDAFRLSPLQLAVLWTRKKEVHSVQAQRLQPIDHLIATCSRVRSVDGQAHTEWALAF